MKIILEANIQGALTGVQADDTLLFTHNVSPAVTKFLAEADDPVPAPHASLCMYCLPSGDKSLVMHWQTGFESFPSNGRFYCTRAIYETDSESMAKCDLSSFVDAMPQLRRFASKEFDVDPFVINVNERNGNCREDMMLKCIWAALAADRRIFVKLSNPQECHGNEILRNAKLHTLLAALNTLPGTLRNAASVAFSLKAQDAAKMKESLFAGMWVVAYYPDSAVVVDTAGAIAIDWTGSTPVCEEDLSKYDTLVEDFKNVSCLVEGSGCCAGWKDMHRALSDAKSYVDRVLDTGDYTALCRIYDKSCKYRSSEVIAALMKNISKNGVRSRKDVEIMKRFAKKGENLDKFLVRMLKSDSLSEGLKQEIRNSFGDREAVMECMGQLSSSLTLKQKYVNFESPLYSLSYSDLSLEKASDMEFVSIYEALLQKKYPGVDVRNIPENHTFPLRYLKIKAKRNPDFIENEFYRKFLRDNGLADEAFVNWLFECGCLSKPENLISLAGCVNAQQCSALVEKYIANNREKINCVDLLKFRLAAVGMVYPYEDYIARNNIPLGNLDAFCKGLSDKDLDISYSVLKSRRVRTLAEWEMMKDSFAAFTQMFAEAFVTDASTGRISCRTMVRLYQKYSDANIREYIESKVLAESAKYPDSESVRKAVKEMGKANREFRRRVSGSMLDRMLSKEGARFAWCLSAAFFVIILVLSAILLSGLGQGKAEVEIPEEILPVETAAADSLEMVDVDNSNQ